MHVIIWPEQYQSGFTDNFVSNEVIEAGLGAAEVWPWLNDTARWPDYYTINASNVRFYDRVDPALTAGVRFYFETFDFPVEAQVVEQQAPGAGLPGWLAWHGWVGEGETRLDVHHTWLIEDLSGGRVRILTQETQNGKPGLELARTRSNPMLNGHQTWLDGLVAAARRARWA